MKALHDYIVIKVVISINFDLLIKKSNLEDKDAVSFNRKFQVMFFFELDSIVFHLVHKFTVR